MIHLAAYLIIMAYSESESENLKALGRTIRSLREERGFSQMELSFRSELDRTYIGSVERGERNISLLNLLKIADALQVHVSMLLEWTTKK